MVLDVQPAVELLFEFLESVLRVLEMIGRKYITQIGLVARKLPSEETEQIAPRQHALPKDLLQFPEFLRRRVDLRTRTFVTTHQDAFRICKPEKTRLFIGYPKHVEEVAVRLLVFQHTEHPEDIIFACQQRLAIFQGQRRR